MSQPALKAKIRKHSGTSASQQDRNQKIIPAVLYGQGMDSRMLTVSESDMTAIFNSGKANALIDLTLGRKKYSVMIKDMQRHKVKGHLIHLDFFAVDMDQPMNATVSIHLTGEAEGVKAGGILQHQLRELDIRCLPTDLPNRVDLDISDLTIGDSKSVADIELPAGVELLSGPEEVIVSVTAPRLEVEEETDTEELDGEPEALEEGTPDED